ncbi:MAG: GTP-binding protein [Bacteroidia bacterium]|nr:GTP-binding protein [Bacteroidia bacterium]NNF31571.1 GTP-binding protein [Flavobacteriaceae bacterium]MBT8275229.1 GTP-binding protein [Bacteroidia bacterium]NNJ81429.1 GTP-binding protein [Flavobacteriaceae bacterium]NNK53261.1 GTP-binding protein [Flavobacteriaceae bacterium]
MSLPNEVVLRPRFKIELERSNEDALQAFELLKKTSKDFVITRVDDHVFLKIPRDKQHYWSPQLDLEIVTFEEGKSQLHGVFGPKPTVWTMFMFLHFAVASLFIGFGIWAYTRASLDEPFSVQLLLMGFMVLAWFVLYFAGRMGKAAGKDEMHLLYNFMKETLDIE